jgi:RimJ/RimL family protein N-acetyltransferase
MTDEGDILTVVVGETARLILRRFTPTDVTSLAAIHADPEVIRFIGGQERWSAERVRDRLSWLAVVRGFERTASSLPNLGDESS